MASIVPPEGASRLYRFFMEEFSAFFTTERMQPSTDPAVKRVSQALLWACALDEFMEKQCKQPYKDFRNADDDGQLVWGSKIGRNRGIHQAAEFIYVDGAGATLPAVFPAPFFELKWKTLSDLPEPDEWFKEREKPIAEVYVAKLQGWPVRFALEAAARFFPKVLPTERFEGLTSLYKDKPAQVGP